MACDLTAGYTKGCAEEVGGIKSLYVAQIEDVDSFTEVGGEITAITVASGGRQFWKYSLESDISNATAVLTRSRENGTLMSDQTVNAILNDNALETRNQLLLLAKNDLFVIVEMASGDYEAYGIVNGAYLETDTRETGTAKADRNGNTLVFRAMEKGDNHPPKVDSTIIAALLTPTV
jgi:hypothetical protein